MSPQGVSFSLENRKNAIHAMKERRFDLVVLGGGITGAAVARDATLRGLSVALIEMGDFASGTSSRSSKLVHGGLRYLENLEFNLVFEALSERSFLMKTQPHLVKPLPFYFPVYKGDKNGPLVLKLGMMLYDGLALFRTPEAHKHFNSKELLKEIPALKSEGLRAGFKYYDASMWDDAMTVETLRDASARGAAIASYVKAVRPLHTKKKVLEGFECQDQLDGQSFEVRGSQVVICAGPWTDLVGEMIQPRWKGWLKPSKGVHLVFDLKRIPVPGAVVMTEPSDGRIAFVIPRKDMGNGVVIVGTTDSPSPRDPSDTKVDAEDETYLLALLNRFFPSLKITHQDVLSSYVGVRPLFAPPEEGGALQKVSREHHIARGPGQSVMVAGGKYTTHRQMAKEIVETALEYWKEDAREGLRESYPKERIKDPDLELPINPAVLVPQDSRPAGVPDRVWDRYGMECVQIQAAEKQYAHVTMPQDPEGYPWLRGQLVHAIRKGMVVKLSDFYHRRVALFLTRKDHGLPWAKGLAQILLEEQVHWGLLKAKPSSPEFAQKILDQVSDISV